MPIKIKRESNEKSDSLDLVKNHAKKQISLKINRGIGSFYELFRLVVWKEITVSAVFMNNSG